MTEGTLAQWLVDDGATVVSGEPIYILETDKVESEIEAPVAGRLRHLVAAGSLYPVGEQVGEIS
jgi:pyruvate/2-oxoglutarate dehydrogenase complex dihydrolipoamide acyltransferase (E2) component